MSDNINKDINFAEAALNTILKNTKNMVFVKDINLVYRGASQSFADLLGLKDPAYIVGKTDFDVFADVELAKRYTDDDRRMINNKEILVDYIEPIPQIDGRPRYTATSKHIIMDDNGNPIGLCGISSDITREYEAQVSYERELRYLFELPPDALAAALFDVTGWRVVDLRVRKDSCHVVSNYSTVDEYINRVAAGIVDNDEALVFFKKLSRESIYEIYESGQRSFEIDYLRSFPNGSKIWVRSEFRLLTDPVNGNLSLLTILFDMDEAKRERDAIKQAAEQDSLTGLLNREATMSSIEQFLTTDGLVGMHALFLIDIDNFKLVNDTFGHQVGDKVITEIANLIKDSFRETDIVGRIGGDEFFVFVKNLDNQRKVRQKAQNLVHALQHVCATPATQIELSASIGISFCLNNNKTLETLYKESDLAMYHSKDNGKNQFSIYKASDDSIKNLMPKAGGAINTVNLHALLNKIDAGIIIYHADVSDKYAQPIFISDSFLSMVGGLTLEEGFDIYHGDPGQSVHPEDRERVMEEYEQAIRDDKAWRSQHRIIGKGGAYYEMSVTSNIIVNADGSVDIYAVYTKVKSSAR